MKMPKEAIETILFAPCGMNCMVCYKHCNHKKPCSGCLKNGEGKPEHCRTCRIKDCVNSKGLSYCFACADYPCRYISSLEKSYRTRYGVSLMDNSAYVKAHGPEDFLERQKEQYTCSACGGVVSLHDAACSECGEKIE